MFPVAVARSASNGVALCYVLPVLWMTSCFHTMGPPIGGQTGTACTSSPVAAGGVQAVVGRPALQLAAASSIAAQMATNTTSPGPRRLSQRL